MPTDSTPSPADKKAVSKFEGSLNELEQLVENMEEKNLSLDDSLKSFERGIKLFRDCQQALEQAELRVQKLLDPENMTTAEPLDNDH